MISRPVLLALIGTFSGAIAWALARVVYASSLAFEIEIAKVVLLIPQSVFPGLVFGLILGAALRWQGKLSAARHALYALAAGLAYLVAYHVAFHLFLLFGNSDGEFLAMAACGVPGGLVGGLLLGLATMRLFRLPAAVALPRPVGTATVFGALLGLLALDHERNEAWGFLAFLVLWQGAYAASLAPVVRAMPGR